MFCNAFSRISGLMVCVLGWCAFVLAEQFPPTTPTDKRVRAGEAFKTDPALQVKITIQFKSPKVHEIVERLRVETKLELTLADNINEEKPALATLICHNVPAWMIMENLAKSKIIEGQWERYGNGYRLTSPLPKPVVKTTPSPSNQPPSKATARLLWTYFLSLAPVFVVLAIVLFRRRRRTLQTDAASEPQSTPQSPSPA